MKKTRKKVTLNEDLKDELKVSDTSNEQEGKEEKKVKPLQYYWFTMILYPDNARHLAFVEKVLPSLPLRVVGITHDRDYVSDDSVLLQIFNESYVSDNVQIIGYNPDEVYKKKHFHLVLKCPAKRTLRGMQKICETYGVEARFIRPCEPFNMMAYLTHATNPEKAQYSREEIWGDMTLYDQYSTYSEQHAFVKFFEALNNFDVEVKKGNFQPTYSNICFFMFQNGLGHLLTKNGNFMYNKMLTEKLKEISQYGLYQNIPHYGKIEI